MSYARLYPGGVINTNFDSFNIDQMKRCLVISKPIDDIAELHKSVNSSYMNTENFEFMKKVISQAISLYGNFYKWLKFQLTDNRFIYGLNEEFLIDTLWYIQTGERKMELAVWKSVITCYPDMKGPKNFKPKDLFVKNLFDNKQTDSLQYIVDWMSHPGGLYDMLYTTYLLFGNADEATLKKLNLST